ncbi:MAG: SDR family oxidoreductase [Hoeflea sp.]|uniref:SDR family oxidoreductase n=1 Tax=Hoeflea sp. TaxID=1940281 RepID=UPI0032EE26BE
MKTVLVAGATGYLGRHLCSEYKRRGLTVLALVRDKTRAADISCDRLVEAEATVPATLPGTMDSVDLVVSALGITRQADGLGCRDVDYQANLNLLEEAMRAGVSHFTYIHVLNADKMKGVPLVDAKAEFVCDLRRADIASTIIAPSGYFSDMGDFLAMARAGRVWLFGDGQHSINPIDGADLAAATADAVDAKTEWLDVGGPDSYTHIELAELAFRALGQPVKITRLPDWIRKTAIGILPWVTPRKVHGPAQFFLTAFGMDMVGQKRGTRRLEDFFAQKIARETAD